MIFFNTHLILKVPLWLFSSKPLKEVKGLFEAFSKFQNVRCC